MPSSVGPGAPFSAFNAWATPSPRNLNISIITITMPRSQYYIKQYFRQQRLLQYNNILKYCYCFVLMSILTQNGDQCFNKHCNDPLYVKPKAKKRPRSASDSE